ncbi:ABC-2 type transport system ATP-binding protein [Paucidesulfovibrio gracilis DSM 16080]|uniref:ABC-2 type transport system ATP-binding protein n=1 Tax=Paucidesulfovibrio gracilis DSM 16080 TaxID=1121449 RepID=A0A1T4WAT7_9BACT|nr:ABC transporter ATP-binding protein [Paucidesulfovibrio gracilis]SKA74383.1 ABC-2 type transport system ATP-binding protein [Paucidesulfovibrio gracilis DSM 16080]
MTAEPLLAETHAPDNPVISVHGLTKQFGDRVVVDGLDMQVGAGEIFGFLGPNGSGKTTFIRMLCGLLRPDSGEGTCLGLDIRTQAASIKPQVGYMAQRFSLYEDLTVKENLEFMARVYGLEHIRDTVDATIQRMGLERYARNLAGSLSGGWKQRLALGACTQHNPRLLLLDEPTAGVDPGARRDFWDEVHKLAGQGLTALISTHYMDEAERCHRLAYIAYGKLLARGTTEELVRGSGLITWTVRSKNGDDEAVFQLSRELEHRPGVDQVVPVGVSLSVCGRDSRTLQSLADEYATEFSWNASETSLEMVFIDLMRNAEVN